MSGSSPAGYTTSTQSVTPSGNAVDYQNSGLNLGGNIYNSGPTYTGLNGDQVSGLNEIARIAGSGNQTANQFYDLAQGFTGGKYLNSNIGNPGLQSLAGNSMNTQGFQNNLTGLGADAMKNPANPYLNSFSQTGATGSTQDMLMKSARGDYLSPDSNPWLKSTYDRGFGQVQNSVDAAMAGSGRFGSGAMAGALGSGATNLANTIYGNNYQQERDRQQQAQQLIGQLQSSDRGQQQQAAQALGQLYDTGVGLGISANADAGQLASGDRSAVQAALGQLSNNYNAGLDATTRMAALSPALNEARYMDMNKLLGVGKAFQDDANAWANEPWQRLNNYMGVAKGLPTSTTQSTSNPYFSNDTANALTGALGGGSLLNTLFGGSGKDGTGPSVAGNLSGALAGGASKLWGGLSSLWGNNGYAAAPTSQLPNSINDPGALSAWDLLNNR